MQNWSLSSCPWTSLDCITSPGLIMSIVISSAPFSLSDLSFSSINSASSISIKTCETNWNHTYVSKPWILSVIWPRNYWDQMCGLILTKCPINHNLANGVNGKQKVLENVQKQFTKLYSIFHSVQLQQVQKVPPAIGDLVVTWHHMKTKNSALHCTALHCAVL